MAAERSVVRRPGSTTVPFFNVVLTFGFAVAGAEALALFTRADRVVDVRVLVHDAVCALALASISVLIAHAAARVTVDTAARMVLTASAAAAGAPLLGLVASEAVARAIMVALSGVAMYLCVRRCGASVSRSLLALAATAALVFVLTAAFGAGGRGIDAALTLTACAAVLLLARRAEPERFSMLAADSRWPKVAHFVLMLVVGVTIALNRRPRLVRPGFPSFDDVLELSVFVAAGVLASVFSTITNNIEDVEIDRLSNAGRPLVARPIDLRWYRAVAYWCLAGSLLCAAVVGIPALLVALAGTGNYFLYSVPPVKLKRVPLVAKFVIAVNSLLVIAAGYVYVRGSIAWFPAGVTALVLVGGTLALNLLDLKDYDGDRAAGIATLPVLLGPRLTKALSAVAVLAMYASTLFWLRRRLGAALVFTSIGVVQAFLITRIRDDERMVMWLHLVALVLASGYYLLYVHRW